MRLSVVEKKFLEKRSAELCRSAAAQLVFSHLVVSDTDRKLLRKRRPEGKLTEIFTLTIDKKLKGQIKREAKKRKKTITDYLLLCFDMVSDLEYAFAAGGKKQKEL